MRGKMLFQTRVCCSCSLLSKGGQAEEETGYFELLKQDWLSYNLCSLNAAGCCGLKINVAGIAVAQNTKDKLFLVALLYG